MYGHLLVRPIHAAWLIAWACSGIVVGVTLGGVSSAYDLSSIAWLLTGIALLLTAIWRRRAWMVLLVLLGGFIIGQWRASLIQSELQVYTQLLDHSVELRGRVIDDVEHDARGRDVLRLGDIHINRHRVAGTIWVTVRHDGRIRRSDVVTVEGKMNEGFGGFAATLHDADVRNVRREEPGDIALSLRDRFASGVGMALEEPEASLGLGYLVGLRRGLPEELDSALVAAGLTHIVVASGYNLTILVRLARRLFERISKYLSTLMAGSLIVGFIAITGLSPSMSRAGLVTGLALLAWYYGRRFHPLVLLPLAMAITVLWQPQYAWGDVGWQLSFAAFAGVMLLAPLLQAYFFADRPDNQLRRILVETIAAQIATLPILLVVFGSFSLVAPLANLLILPLIPLAMLLTLLAGFGGLIVPAFAPLIGLPAQWLLTYMTQTAQLTGGFDWALQQLPITLAGAVLCYGALIGFAVYMWWKTKLNLRNTDIIE